jgi:cytochrome c553
MKRLMLGIALSLALVACTDQGQAPGDGAKAKQPPGDAAAGKALAERECKGCHGLDGKGAAPAIPHLAAQRDRYLVSALLAYRDGKRTHAAVRDIAKNMTESDARNVAAYYASQPPVQGVAGNEAKRISPYDHGKTLSSACAKCHGADGNSTTSGTPTLAGQQPQYLVIAIQEYLKQERKAAPMHALLPGLTRLDMESLALYFASQPPAARTAPPFGDPKAGEPLTAVCGGCHGANGVSTDSATPSLASQDPRYLVEAVKAYRTTRKRENMRLYVTGLSEKDIESIAAFYSVQKSHAPEKGATLVKDLSDKCDRCHGNGTDPAVLTVPKIKGQDRDSLLMALRA